jgi:hypothetical protein
MTVKEYFQKLQQHDWFYDYSDDHRVWQRGVNSRDELYRAFSIDEKFKVMYNDYYAYIGGKRDTQPKLEDYQ